jgi:hypothetical protein
MQDISWSAESLLPYQRLCSRESVILKKCVSKVKTPHILNILEEHTTLLSGLFTAEGEVLIPVRQLNASRSALISE